MLSPLNSNSLVGLMELALLLPPLDLPPLVKKEVTQSALHGVLGPVHTPAVSNTMSSRQDLTSGGWQLLHAEYTLHANALGLQYA